MKIKLKLLVICPLLSALCLPAFAQGSAFTYQGRLNDGASPASGIYDLRFTIYDSTNIPGVVIAGPLTNAATTLSNGLFTATLDFGAGVFTGSARWLDIGVRTNGATGFTTLSPRRALTPTPYAITAEGVISGGVTSVMLASGAVTVDKIAAGAVNAQKIDDGGAAVYQGFQFAEQGLGGDQTLAFANLSPATNAAAFSLTINSAAFGTVVGFSGFEGVSQPPYYTVQVSSPSPSVNPDTELGLPAQLTYTRGSRVTTFGGLVTACTLSGSDGTSYFYSVRIEPPLAYLALKTDYRMYQNLTVQSVASSVYQTVVGSPPTFSLTGSYTPHDSLTQYGETSLNFLSRLLENEGIFYFFNQSTAVPGIVLADHAAAYLASPNSPFAYYGNAKTNVPVAEYIRSFQKASHQSTLTSTVDSYDFTKPALSLLFSTNAPAGLQEKYEFGNDIQTLAYDRQLALARMTRQTVERLMISGSATAPDLRAGYTFTLSDQSGAGVGGSYVVTSVHHAGFVRVTNGVSTIFYGNQFQAIPATSVCRPARATPRPTAQPTSAVVTGQAGEEIYTDKYGRVKVQFHWDRLGVNDENSSAWLRVATPMASSNGRGMIFLPRIGDEVLVTFLDGDPDQPLVFGSLYNAVNMPPYALPGSKTVSTIRSTGTPGQPSQVNEIKFNDAAGSQLLSLQGAKDLSLSASGTVSMNASNVTIAGDATVNGDLDVAGTISGAIANLNAGTGTFSNGVSVASTMVVGSTLDVAGNTTIGGTLDVTGATRLKSTLTAGTSLFTNTVSIAKNTTVGGTLLVSGTATFSNSVTAGSFSGNGSNLTGIFSLDAADGSPTDAVFVNNAGKVGVGLTNPLHQLHVGNTLGTNAFNASTNVIAIEDANENGRATFLALAGTGGPDTTNRVEVQIEAVESSRRGIIGTTTEHPLYLRVGNSDVMILATNRFVGINTSSPTERLHVIGNILASGTITPNSDRNAKTDIQPVDVAAILERVTALPIQQWRFKAESEQVKHLGPMAQDFRAAFGLGAHETAIATVDADGVALAAIQGLNQKLTEELKRKETEITELQQRLAHVEQMLSVAHGKP